MPFIEYNRFYVLELINGPEEVNFDLINNRFRRHGSITSHSLISAECQRSASTDINWNKPPPVLQRGEKTPKQSNRNIPYPHQLQSINDLDSYVMNSHESDFVFRRATPNVRSNSRRSLINRHFTHSLSNSAVNASSTSNLNTATELESTSPETSQLLNFLNIGLEMNNQREQQQQQKLLTTASSFNISSNDCKQNEEYEQTSNSGFVKLRRSSSIADVADANARLSYRRGITSAILKEEEASSSADLSISNDNNKSQNNEKALNGRNPRRLSSLKKLGSLYREFDELDDEYFEKNRTKKNKPNIKYIDESDSEANRSSSVQATEKVTNKTGKTDLDESYINSKFKYTSELRNSNLVLDRIMKFENKADVNDSASPNNRSLNETSEEKQTVPNKVKSLSKNWEIISSRSSNPNSLNNSISNSKPLQIETAEKMTGLKSGKFAMLDSTMSSNSSNVASPNPLASQKLRLNSEFVSSSTSSDNEHSSKDDGFETQSNASLSQKSDTVTIKIQKAEKSGTSDSSVADLGELLININTSGQEKLSSSDETDDLAKPKFETFSCTAQDSKQNESLNCGQNRPKQQTIVTITTRSRKKSVQAGSNNRTSGGARPQSTSITTSITKKTSCSSSTKAVS